MLLVPVRGQKVAGTARLAAAAGALGERCASWRGKCESVGMAQTGVSSFRRRWPASAGHCRGSQSPTQTWAAGAHRSCWADRLPVQEVARRAGVSRPAVWRWQARYAEQGVDGLLRDKTHKPGRPQGAYFLADRAAVNRLKAARVPREGYSATILRFAKQEVVTA